MNKKILSLVLALVMVLGTFTSVFAAETKTEAKEEKATEKVEKIVGKENKIQYIIDKKFVEGYEDGDYGFDKNIKRSEITKLLVFANGNKELAEKLQGSMKLYTDVETSHWANGVITVGTTVPAEANGQAMLQGYPDKSFKPEQDVTYAELAKMLVVLVKEDLTADMVTMANKNWAAQWMTWAAQLGILDDVTVADSSKAANRADAFTMMYNALYKMANFKRVPANDKVGVLSSLKNNELVLNQDKDQTYKLTDKTVLVNTLKENVSNIIKVENITNAEYYYGSLVRIMTNDKNEVTHILELGNPEEMALGREANDPGSNNRWEGVADNTVETGLSDVDTLKDKDVNTTSYDKGYVTVQFKSNNTKVDTIKFMNGNDVLEKTLEVNSDTKVYIANPANNIMKEVDDINAALSYVGFQNYRSGYAIPNVYAGYDDDSHTAAISNFNNGGDLAKVVVFNVVSKSVGGDLYRVVNESNYNGKATLENTAGELMDKDFFNNIANFPYNYGDKWDVVEVNTAANGYDSISKEIDHSDTVEFPIVEVTKIYNDKKSLEVKDEYNYKSVLNVRDADIFNAKQFKDLEVGAKVQFKVDNEENATIAILSILPDNMKIEGSINDIINAVNGDTVVAKEIYSVNSTNAPYTMTVKAYNNIFNTENNLGEKTYTIGSDDAKLVKELFELNKDVKLIFTVSDLQGQAGKLFASNIKVLNNDGSKTSLQDEINNINLKAAKDALNAKITDANNKKDGVKISADGSDVAQGTDWVTQAVQDTFDQAITNAEAARDDANATVQSLEDAKTDLENAIAAYVPEDGTM